MRNKIYYYRNKEEFDKFYNEHLGKIIPFEFVEAKKIIEEKSDNIIDITNMISYIDTNYSSIYAAIINLKNLDSKNKIIINKDWHEKALYLLPTIFDESLPLFDEEKSTEIYMESSKITLFYYTDAQYEKLLEYTKQNKIIVSNFASIQKYTNYDSELVLDITNIIASSEENSSLIYILEQYFAHIKSNIKVIINYNKLDEVKKTLRLVFSKYENVSELYNEVTNILPETKVVDKPVKITDLNENKIINLFNNINDDLIGHTNFKMKLISQLKKFLILNKIGEQKIFSMFLLGKPGLGKTEIGKIISKTLNPDSKIIKINFGNLSSKDALNSLIGSPAGYIGCEGGELSKKVSLNKVGVVICDEFEKADSEIKNFFLELLEDGQFTDSMGREHDLNGYVIIFTSNIHDKKEFKQKISPEFESRVNLICEFTPLTSKEKKKYVKFQMNCFKEKIKKENPKVNINLKNIEIQYEDTDDLREIKKRVLDKMSEFL